MSKRSNDAVAVKRFGKRAAAGAGLLLLAWVTMAWSQTIEPQSSTDTEVKQESSANQEPSQSSETATDTNNTTDDKDVDTTAQTSNENKKQNNRDPIGASADERFIPTEEISEDLPVSFPVDI